MTENTINDGATMGGATGTMLVNRYRVIRQLGQGGMGSVWLAEDTLLDNRQVAIKMLPPILVSNKRAYNQLKSEALVSLKLTHPNIAAVRAFEENNGNPFLVVDYVDGLSLDEYLGRKGKLTEEAALSILQPVAKALDYAHSKGIVHRDVKPGNVVISWDGDPYVLDFGIAREIQETLTRVTGKLSSGTLMYMSPEQLNGEAPSAAQDVYSFAAMAYECLTGAPPFSRGNIEYQIMNKEPAPLDPNLAACVPGIMSGLAKRPEDRPDTCVDVLAYASAVPETPPPYVEEVSEPSAVSGTPEPYVEEVSEPSGVGAPPPPADGGDDGARGDGRARAPREPRRWGMTVATLLVIAAVCGARYVWHQGRQVKILTLPGGAKLELMWCPPGSFMMGSPAGEEGRNEVETQHRVTLTKGFWIGKYEVTQGQWQSVMGSNPSRFKGENRPVENVSWNDCQEFCREAGQGLRLPTEAEWEYACRAGTTAAFAGTGRLDDMGWYGDNSRSTTHDVGTKRSNAWGLYDMHGSVWEWCADWYGAYGGAETDPTGPASGEWRVDRGGSWGDYARFCRSAFRYWRDPGYRSYYLGFRVCCSAGPSE